MNFIPALLKKTITFQRLPAKNVIAYEIYAKIPDSNYDSGIRNELLEVFDNPLEPEPRVKRIELAYNKDATWKLPDDAYIDRDHQFRLYLNDFILGTMAYTYNRVNKLISMDIVMKNYTPNDKVELEYYQDLITRSYMLEKNCQIYVKPIFTDSYTYGYHNVII